MRAAFSLHQRRDMFADGGPHLESVARTSANEPHVLQLWMSIDEKMPISRRFVLTDARLDQGSFREVGETLAYDRPRTLDPRCAGHSLYDRGVNLISCGIVRFRQS